MVDSISIDRIFDQGRRNIHIETEGEDFILGVHLYLRIYVHMS